MNQNEYQNLAITTEGRDATQQFMLDTVADMRQARLLHAAFGMVTEAGEFMDVIKRRMVYGKPMDEVNLREELGDMLWYIALAINALDSSFGAMFRMNIEKLQKRFPNKFTPEQALNRDLDGERKVLEANS